MAFQAPRGSAGSLGGGTVTIRHEIIHRSRKHHSNADGLSRIPDPGFSCDCYSAGRDLDSLPCGGCTFCRQAHEQWACFADDVDGVVPLAMHRLLPVETESPEIRQVSATPPDGNLQSNPCSSPNWARGYANQRLRQKRC